MSNYYDYREVKVMIAHRLMALDGWKVYDYSPDQSDSMTDYYCPATWGGVAEKNGYILCVDVYGAREAHEIRKYNHSGFSYDKNITNKIKKLEAMTVERGASEAEAESAKMMIERLQKKAEESTENNNKYVVVGTVPGHQAHPTRCNWHIEKNDVIIAKGNGILKYSGVYHKQDYKKRTEEEIREQIKRTNSGRSWFNDEELEKSVRYQLEEQEEALKLKADFDKFINKLDTTCGGLLGEGDGTIYEKVTVTEYKTENKVVESVSGTIKEGQCFILKGSFNYGCYKGLVYRIHENKTERGSYFTAYKLNGKLTKECTGKANQNNRWGTFGEKFLKWIEQGLIAWCDIQEEKVPYEVEKVVKKTVKSQNTTEKSQAEELREEETINDVYTYDIIEDIDTRDNSIIWVVKVKEKLSREEYKQLNESMGNIGGYYSRFKHGFIFKSDPTGVLTSNFSSTKNEEEQIKTQPEEPKEQPKPIIEYDVTEDKSLRDSKIVYLVKVRNELSKADFTELKRNLAKIGGFHSSIKDGFVFKYDPTEKLIV